MNKEIGIVTFHSTHNYGAVLQSHALSDFLRSEGEQPVFVNLLSQGLEDSNRKKIKIDGLKSLVKRLMMEVFRGKLNKRFERFEKYRSQFLKLTRRYRTFEELRADPPELDLYISGSDQVWNMEQGGDPLYFLQFLESKSDDTVSCIAYAPSFGTGTIPGEFEDRFRDWGKVFDFVSVRESSGKEIAERLLNREVPQVVDPVFLHDRKYWDDLSESRMREKPYLAFYSLETSGPVSKCLLRMAKALGLTVVVLGKPGPFMLRCPSVVAIDAGPAEFLSWLRHAEFIVTNSFHATAFATIFEVPFMTVAHTTRNARMESLLALLGQEERIVATVDELSDERIELLSSDADMKEVLEREYFRSACKESKDYLRNALAVAGGNGG